MVSLTLKRARSRPAAPLQNAPPRAPASEHGREQQEDGRFAKAITTPVSRQSAKVKLAFAADRDEPEPRRQDHRERAEQDRRRLDQAFRERVAVAESVKRHLRERRQRRPSDRRQKQDRGQEKAAHAASPQAGSDVRFLLMRPLPRRRPPSSGQISGGLRHGAYKANDVAVANDRDSMRVAHEVVELFRDPHDAGALGRVSKQFAIHRLSGENIETHGWIAGDHQSAACRTFRER